MARLRLLVSGSQTGGLSVVDGRHYALVTACDPQANRLVAEGPIAPSSESLTHGMLYALDEAVQFVSHVHSPEIWRQAEALGVPLTGRHAAYGTPQMASEVARLFTDESARRVGAFAMGGHEDGIVSFGRSAEQAGTTLIGLLARALTRILS